MSRETWAINKIADTLSNDKLDDKTKLEHSRAVIVVYNSIAKEQDND